MSFDAERAAAEYAFAVASDPKAAPADRAAALHHLARPDWDPAAIPDAQLALLIAIAAAGHGGPPVDVDAVMRAHGHRAPCSRCSDFSDGDLAELRSVIADERARRAQDNAVAEAAADSMTES
jgi:hypothetical protein